MFVTTTDVQESLNLAHDHLILKNTMSPGCDLVPLEPALASKWQWVDDRTLDLSLREGVKFPNRPPLNGREFVANDVAYTITKQWPRNLTLAAMVLPFVQSVEAVGKYQVRIRLKSPFGAFPDTLAEYYAFIMGPESFESDGTLKKVENNVGLGPFMLTSHSLGVGLGFQRNPNYWQEGVPFLEGIKLSVVPEYSTALAAFRAKRLDFMFFPGLYILAEEAKRTIPGVQSYSCPTANTLGLFIRTDEPPFNDVRVRRALSMAIDREAVRQTIWGGEAAPLYGSVPSIFPDHYMKKEDFPPEVRKYIEYNPAEARKLLAEAGYGSGLETSIATTTRFREMSMFAEAVFAFVDKVGVKAPIRLVDYALFTPMMEPPAKFRGLAVYWGFPGETVEFSLRVPFMTGDAYGNRGYVSDPAFDKMIGEFRDTVDPLKLRELSRKMQTYQVEQAWVLWAPLGYEFALAHDYVKDIKFKALKKEWRNFARYMWLQR